VKSLAVHHDIMVKHCNYKKTPWTPKAIENTAKELRVYLDLGLNIEAENSKMYSRSFKVPRGIVIRVDGEVLQGQ